MEPKLMTYIWRHSSRQQISLIILTVLSFPILYLSLELPKMIVNDAIIAHETAKNWFGYDFGAIEYVLVLSGIYLFLVLGNGIFKMRINTFRGIVGERMLRRLRFSLIDRSLRFPLPHYSRVSPGEVISTVTAETEPLAGFIGDSYALPAFQGGTMLTILAFMFIQDPLLGLASVSMIPLQIYIIPRLQKKVNALKKERVKKVRKLSEQLNEAVVAAQEVRIQGTHRYHLADFSMHLGGIFWTRLKLYEAKFFMKFINNLLNQLTPILFFSLGGILVIQGNINVGILTAALTAYKDMTAPWKELLNYYQTFQDSLIKYEQIRENFEPEGLVNYDHINNAEDLPQKLEGPLQVKDLSANNDSGDRLLSKISFTVNQGDLLIIDSKDTAATKRLAQAMRGLMPYDSGSVHFGDLPLMAVPHVTLGRRVALVGPEPTLFNGSFMQNLHYGMRHAPRPDTDETLTDERRQEIQEAELSGNSHDRMDEIWTDFTQPEVEDFRNMREWFQECTEIVGSAPVLLRNGLFQAYSLDDRPDYFVSSFVSTRNMLKDLLAERGADKFIHKFDWNLYNPTLTVLENVFFSPDCKQKSLTAAALSDSRAFLERLVDHDLWHDAASTGMAMARQVHALLGDIDADDPLLEQFNAFDKDVIDAAIQLRDRIEQSDGIMQLHPEDESLILQMFMAITPEKHGNDLISTEMAKKLLALRLDLAENPLDIDFDFDCLRRFDQNDINPNITIMENLVFGRLVDMPSAKLDWLVDIVTEALAANDAKEFVMVLFGFSEVGIGGSRVSVLAKQRVQILRSIMKKPDIIIMQEPMSVMTPEERVILINNIRRSLPKTSIIWMDQNIPATIDADKRYSLVDGRLSGSEIDEEEADVETSHGENAMRELLTLLENDALFGPLPKQKRQLLAATGETLSLDAGEWLYREGSDAENAYLIIEGHVEIGMHMGNGQFHHQFDMHAGDTAGIPEIVSGTPRFAAVRAAAGASRPARVLRINGAVLLDLMEEDGTIAMRALALMGTRLSARNKS